MIVDKARQENVNIENIKKGYSISRKMASKLLNVSTRTVDRYVKDSRLSTVTIDGRIWLNKGEINDIRFKKSHGIVDAKTRMSTLNMSIDKVVDKVDSVDSVNRHESLKKEKNSEQLKFQEELNKQKESINLLSYKIENFEKKLRNSSLENGHSKEVLKFKIEKQELEKKLQKEAKINQGLSIKYKKTYIKKYIFLVILLLILALQPLWFLIHLDKFF